MKATPRGTADRRRDRKFRTYGDTAIMTETVDSQEGPRREMQVWVKQAGHWKCAAVQMTMIAAPER